MKRWVLAATVALSVLSGCGTSPLQACKDRGAADCKKMWSCTNVAVKLGTDEASCVTSMDTLCSLTGGSCASGKAIDVAKATACTADIQSASCDQYNAGSYKAANCDAAKCQ
jgi:hypothetical protein